MTIYSGQLVKKIGQNLLNKHKRSGGFQMPMPQQMVNTLLCFICFILARNFIITRGSFL